MKTTYKNLVVWQWVVELARAISELTEGFPKEEIYGLTSQMRRAAVSIPSNIAEGKLRGHQKERRQFFLAAFGSAGELKAQIEIAKTLRKTKNLDYGKVESLLQEVRKILHVLIDKISLIGN